MLEAGFIPSFYHFVDTILEIKMEVHIREEETSSKSFNETMSSGTETQTGGEVSTTAKVNYWLGSAEMSAKASWSKKSTSAYSRTVDAKHSQSFSQDLSATSLMRTKIVPIPPPELLVERIKILLEKIRKEAGIQKETQGETRELDQILMEKVENQLLERVEEAAAGAGGEGQPTGGSSETSPTT